jgi:hypothetical protein
MVQAFYMQVLQVLSGDGWLYLSSPGLLALQWLRSVPLFQFVPSKLPSLFLTILCFSCCLCKSFPNQILNLWI